MSTGRTAESRQASIGTTNGSTSITGPADTFSSADVGAAFTSTNTPATARIAAVASATAATLTVAATATGSTTATIGASTDAGFTGWSPETQAESESYTVAAVNAGTVTPDRITSPAMERTQRGRT